MKYGIIIASILAAMLMGCANSATRLSLDPGEGVYSFSHDTSKDQLAAYYTAEEWLSTTIANPNQVVSLRQPNTGTLIANPMMQISVVGVPFWCNYTLKIVCKDNQLNTAFTVGRLENGAYPPRNAMPDIQARFNSISNDLHLYVEQQ